MKPWGRNLPCDASAGRSKNGPSLVKLPRILQEACQRPKRARYEALPAEGCIVRLWSG